MWCCERSKAHSALGPKKAVREGIVHKYDLIRAFVRYYEIYILELYQLFAAALYAELFEPTPL